MNTQHLRRMSQIFFFIIIIYGGVIVANTFDIQPKELAHGMEGEVSIIEAPLPLRTCRYIEPSPTLFSSCGLKYVLDRPLYLGPILPIALYLLIIIGLCFVFARFMCGWFCPLGFLSDIFDYFRKKLLLNRITLPDSIKKILKYWRYSFLLFLFFLSFAIITPLLGLFYLDKNYYAIACQVCPARIIFPLFGGIMPNNPSFISPATSVFSTISILFLIVFLLGLIISRSWCRICPNGTFISFFSKGALIAKNKDVRKCTKCGICKRVCPFTNDHVFEEKHKENINSPHCVMCLNCVEKCPEEDCLYVTFAGKKLFRSRFKNK